MPAPALVRIPSIPAKALAHERACASIDELCRYLDPCQRLLVLTGAGISTASGIPAYRDLDGQWRRRQPIMYQAFVSDPLARQRYWARSFVGWPYVANAQPSPAHHWLVELQRLGRVSQLITQNVDRLHQQAGSAKVLELHGNLHDVRCLDCGQGLPRQRMQARLREANPDWQAEALELRPDGDAELEAAAVKDFVVPDCEHCGGRLKPDVVFFGESVPSHRNDCVQQAIADCDGLLVVGSSLVVMSGYRIVRQAVQRGLPTAAMNLGRTRADDILGLKCAVDCQHALQALCQFKA
jgi:NAD-dependent SIR2 family protein deacetylase